MSAAPVIREVRDDDASAILAIYREGIATGHATFETDPPDWGGWMSKFPGSPRLVAEVDGRVAAWAVASPVSDRAVYRGVAEETIYVAAAARGRGVGRALLDALIEATETQGVWTLQAGIFPENESSLRLHEACGFRRVGIRDRIGRMGDRWRDVVLLERRSNEVGT